MKLEVLLSTMDFTGEERLAGMNIRTDAVIGNQTSYESLENYTRNGKKVLVVNTTQRGLSYNRNQTLLRASGDIELLADDDVVYYDNYEKTILREFRKHPRVDLILFNVEESGTRRQYRPTIRPFMVGRLNYMRFGSARIAFRTKSVQEAGIFFNIRYGAGTDILFGEDTLFLRDCLDKGLRIYASDKYICSVPNGEKSTWFKGYDDSFFRSKALVYRKLNRRLMILLCFQDAVRHYKMYGEKSALGCFFRMSRYFMKAR